MAFWPLVASRTSSTSCGRARRRLVDDPLHLLELLHERRLGVEPAGGVAEHDVHAAASTPSLHRLEAARSAGSAPSLPRTIGAPTRSAQISSCSPAAARKVSPAPSSTVPPGRLQLGGELADGGGLARAVDAHHHHHPGPRRRRGARPAGVGSPSRARMRAISSRSAASSRAGSESSLARHAGADRLEQRGGGRDADVGGEEHLLELGQHRLVERPARRRAERVEAGHEAAAGPRQAGRRASCRPRPRPCAPLLLARAGCASSASGARALAASSRARRSSSSRSGAPALRSSAAPPPSCWRYSSFLRASAAAEIGGRGGRGRGEAGGPSEGRRGLGASRSISSSGERGRTGGRAARGAGPGARRPGRRAPPGATRTAMPATSLAVRARRGITAREGLRGAPGI